MGWNGSAAGHEHCCDRFKDLPKNDWYNSYHREWTLENELHAEWNAICFAAKQGISTDGADMYISLAPCSICANLILASGIKRVFYKKTHSKSNKAIEKLKQSIQIEQLTENK